MKRGLRNYGYIGILLIILVEVSLILDLTDVTRWATPIAWTGYILLIDSIIFRLKKQSLIISRTKEFLIMLPLSIGFWLIFDGYNLFLRNWYYINLPSELWLRWIGYAWAFATITPGIFETTELLETLNLFSRGSLKQRRVARKTLIFLIFVGVTFLICPLVCSKYANYMAALVWAGFIFLLDPLNYMLGTKSILRDWEEGRISRFLSLCCAGFICGILWEFWNFWAYTKWIYTIPVVEIIKIFEMPILGYIGFPALALELYVMYNFARISKTKISQAFLRFKVFTRGFQ